MMTPKKKKKLSFEEGMKCLEEIVAGLNDGNLALEDSISLYEQGTALAQQLHEMLDAQKRRIETINPDTAEIELFEENDHDVQ